MAKEILLTQLGDCFGPSDNLSQYGINSKWRTIPYRTGDISGTMLSSLGKACPEDVSYDPKLEGWYKIYVCLPAFSNMEVLLKLTQDDAFYRFTPLHTDGLTFTRLEESFWRYAKMDGQAITMSKKTFNPTEPLSSVLAWLRFVPMTDSEVEALMARRADSSTKCIYATDDVHNRMYFSIGMEKPENWDIIVQPYEDSDVEWLSLEEINTFIHGPCAAAPDDFAFLREGDRSLQNARDSFDSFAILERLVKKGQAMGMKMSLSLRMGAWGIGYPFDQCYFDLPMYLENPQWRCVMRDGVAAAAFSYAFPEVRQYMVDTLVKMAKCGCDAVTIIAHRGIPYVLYEEPVVKKFRELYGEDPYDLPLDDPRLNGVHCGIMTDFFRQVRHALDEAVPERHVEVHLRSLHSMYDNKYVGIDCETLAQEGLVDAIISYPNRYREVYGEGCILPNGRVDLERYKQYVNDPSLKPYLHQGDRNCFDPVPDSRGVLQGPNGVEENAKQWLALEARTGVKIYIDIMPRVMEPEILRSRTLELYNSGVTRFALWDTYGRVPVKSMWSLARNMGHRDLMENPTEPSYRLYQLKELAGNDISRSLPIWGG